MLRKKVILLAHNIPISGYLGLMTFAGNAPEYGMSIYCITDTSHSTLLMMPLTYGFLHEAYNIAKLPTYQRVIILMPSINDVMCSDLFSLIRLLIPKKGIKNVIWVSPDIRDWSTSYMYETQLRTTELNLYQYGMFDHMCPYIKFIPSKAVGDAKYEIYDIAIWDGEINRYFMNVIRIKALGELMPGPDSLRTPPEIHLPYEPTWFGVTGYDLFKDLDKLNQKRSQVLLDDLQTQYWELHRYNFLELSSFTGREIETLHVQEKLDAFDKMKRKSSFVYHSFPSYEILEEMVSTFGILVGEVKYDGFI